ncbi:DUF6480 family protein [Gordonia soli]|uniref:Uncharacterized protein n=1 Tax=Gordonia soli NBRC 108243 TaxID=1223545 RepID=M0QP12_9ACTN|nr:DUF6480 family protein [Gordonia soli]GAC69182.1 hypothetical protein GS4_22_00140 [Gordonia soli NBRC 108243]
MTDPNRSASAYEPQNPEPDDTAGLERGGGVQPGDVPPVSTNVGGPNHEPPIRSRAGGYIVVGVCALVILIVAIGMFGRAINLF